MIHNNMQTKNSVDIHYIFDNLNLINLNSF